jgi:hypothetical protein
MVTVTSISGSGPYTVGISPGVYMPNWTSAKTPQAWWATGPVFLDGVRNLTMNHTSSNPPNGVVFFNCLNCWVSAVTNIMSSGGPSETHVRLFISNRITIQNSYFFQTASSPTVQYGIEPFPSSDSLIQNNIFQAVEAPVPVNGSCSGCVISYNFDVNNVFNPTSWLNQGEFLHAVADNVLFEGNEGAGLYSDNSHGTHHFVTVFRTAGNGYQQNMGALPSGSTTPLQIDAFSRMYNVIGNVWGSPMISTNYASTYSNGVVPGTSIYVIGTGDEIPNDPNTGSTLMLWGNYSTVTQSTDTPANSGIRFLSSEVPSGISQFANPVPSSNTLPTSFYLSGQPSWWTSGIPWPAVGPDVTGGNLGICMGGTNVAAYVTSSSQCPNSTVSTLAGHANAIPAAKCYLNTMAGPPSGVSSSAVTFNPTTCYGAADTQLPAAPTNLTATVD